MTSSLSITVVGAGAIGSAVAFSLARAGFAPKLGTRGETLAAIRCNGLHVGKLTCDHLSKSEKPFAAERSESCSCARLFAMPLTNVASTYSFMPTPLGMLR